MPSSPRARPRPSAPTLAALRAGQLLFLSGQVPLDPATGMIIDGDIAAQTRQVLENIGTLLEPAACPTTRWSARPSFWRT